MNSNQTNQHFIEEEIKETAQMGVEAVGATPIAAQWSSNQQSRRILRSILEAVHADPTANLILGVTKSTYQVVFVRDPGSQ